MKKTITVLAVILAAALAGVLTWSWCNREEPDFRRKARREAIKGLRAAKPDEVLPYLSKLSTERVFRVWFKDEKIWNWRCAYETRVPADFIAQLTEEAFIRFAGNGSEGSEDVPRLKELLSFSETAIAACETKAAADSLRLRRLDGYFLTKDYDGAVAALENGIPGQTPEWCRGTIAKLRAHQALDKGDKKAAIGHFLQFGEFMSGDAMKDFEDCDPTTGVIYSREWVVARNYARCAKLAAETGDAAKAAEYRAKAKPLFDTALEKAKDDARSLEALKKEIGSTPL